MFRNKNLRKNFLWLLASLRLPLITTKTFPVGCLPLGVAGVRLWVWLESRMGVLRRNTTFAPPTMRRGVGPLAFIVSANLMRRNLTKGQQAVVLAMVYPEGHKGKTVVDLMNKFSRSRLSQARSVLRYSRQLA
ncbi:MAG: hypothetical protein WA817_24325 [Candidatus Acidiferrum sp.]